MEKTARLELRLDPYAKAALQHEAERAGVSVSELVRERMVGVSPPAQSGTEGRDGTRSATSQLASVADGLRHLLDSSSMYELLATLRFCDADVADVPAWTALANEHGVDLKTLVLAAALYANAEYLDLERGSDRGALEV